MRKMILPILAAGAVSLAGCAAASSTAGGCGCLELLGCRAITVLGVALGVIGVHAAFVSV